MLDDDLMELGNVDVQFQRNLRSKDMKLELKFYYKFVITRR